jgi:hypothetical protein
MHDFDEHVNKMQLEMDDKIEEIRGETEGVAKASQTQEAEMRKMRDAVKVSPTVPLRGGVPYELRVHAMIGSLGWDTDGCLLKQRAIEALASAGTMDAEWHKLSPMVGRTGKDSGCEVWFVQTDGLSQARNRMHNCGVSFDGRRPVWIDAKKSREEMQPARMTHRLDYLSDVAPGRGKGLWPSARTLERGR